MKVAIVRLSSLGDIIFCMASLQLIRRHAPHARVSWFADSRFGDILDHNPDLESVVKLDLKGLKRSFSMAGVAAEYRKVSERRGFDVVIDLHGMLKSAAVGSLLSGRRAGFHRSVAKEPLASLFYGETFKVARELPAVQRFALLAAGALGFEFAEEELTELEPFLFSDESDRQSVAPWFSVGKKNVLLVPGSSVAYKNYPMEKYLQIAQKLDAEFLVCHGGQQELQVAQYLAEGCSRVKALPPLSLNQLKAVVAASDLVIGGDTGPTHMAWACNVPSITLYGATPANCVYPGPACRQIASASKANLKKPDKNDFSVGEIDVRTIVATAEELLA